MPWTLDADDLGLSEDIFINQGRTPMLGELKFDFSREDILERVTANRAKHEEDLTEATEGYYIALEEELADIAKRARAQAKVAKESKDPEEFHFGVTVRKPESHLNDYDRVIDMLTLAQDDVIILDEGEFSTYVRDEWQWKRAFTESAAYYSNVKNSR